MSPGLFTSKKSHPSLLLSHEVKPLAPLSKPLPTLSHLLVCKTVVTVKGASLSDLCPVWCKNGQECLRATEEVERAPPRADHLSCKPEAHEDGIPLLNYLINNSAPEMAGPETSRLFSRGPVCYHPLFQIPSSVPTIYPLFYLQTPYTRPKKKLTVCSRLSHPGTVHFESPPHHLPAELPISALQVASPGNLCNPQG